MPEPNNGNPGDTVLRYRTDAARSKTLQLQEEDGAVIVTFPAAPDWLWAFQVGMAGALGFGYFAMAAKVARFIYRWAPPGTAATPQTLAPMAMSALWIMLPGVVWWTIAGYAWWSRRRGAGTSRVLIATRERLTLRRFAWTGNRDTIWRADSIDRIELKTSQTPGERRRWPVSTFAFAPAHFNFSACR